MRKRQLHETCRQLAYVAVTTRATATSDVRRDTATAFYRPGGGDPWLGDLWTHVAVEVTGRLFVQYRAKANYKLQSIVVSTDRNEVLYLTIYIGPPLEKRRTGVVNNSRFRD